MVGPVSDEERESATTKVKLAFTALIGFSAALVTLQVNPSPLVFASALAGGLVVGWLLVWYVFPDTTGLTQRESRRRR
jgi:membrane associated rhomboid family serine protease